MSSPTSYSAARVPVDGIDVVRLADSRHNTEVSIVPAVGNIAYEMRVNGTNVFWTPYQSVAQFKAHPIQLGNPFLAPWANRLDGDAFWANGRKYILNPGLNNIHRDGNRLPIHGLVQFSSHWEVVAIETGDSGAWTTSRLEFWRYPDYVVQYPFAHDIEMTHRLVDGVLEVQLAITNRSIETMPLSVAFHPYFTLSDTPRDDWHVHLPVREKVVLDEHLIPTGATEPAGLEDSIPLKNHVFDTVFSGVEAERTFSVTGRTQRIAVRFGPKYPVAVVYAPPGRNFVCFEPMSGVTNAFNLAAKGHYPQLQTIPAGGKWEESFWIAPSGF